MVKLAAVAKPIMLHGRAGMYFVSLFFFLMPLLGFL